ncbi:SDR family NAD(P)-dependent oxidoreductase [Peribacillus butanolivorans]|uniref:SDR family NAD(P)-dependent oxidoreductase n=1 Tax=Peribacillus butanolivorans TaxID=421767 RepID=UPI0036298BA3
MQNLSYNNGDFVAIVDLNEEATINAAEKLGNVKDYKVNAADEPNVKDAVDQVIVERGTGDVLVKKVGLQFISPVEDFPVEKWDLVNDVILKGTFLLTKYVLPTMQKKKDASSIFPLHTAEARMYTKPLIVPLNLDKLAL